MGLRLVDEGKILIEKSLHSYLKEDWLPVSVYRDSIMLRHVVSHSSGLGKISKNIMFKPGTAYYYSANGFNFLKEVMEEVTQESFEDLAQQLLFEPLQMTTSSFAKQDQFIPMTANGHIRAVVPIVLFCVLYTVLFMLVLIIGLVTIRLKTKFWKLKRSLLILFHMITFMIFVIPIFILFGFNSIMEFAWVFAISGLVLLLVFLLMFYIGRISILKRFPERLSIQIMFSFSWGLLIAIVILFFSTKIHNLPVPKSTNYNVSPAGTLRTSAQEMASFLIELAYPQFLSKENSEKLRTPQIKLTNNLSWGMGPGILYSDEGYALWQWGQHIDFQSILIIYPEHKFGVVVCTNNDLLNPDVALEIAHHSIGGLIEPLRSAIHLNYDFRGEH